MINRPLKNSYAIMLTIVITASPSANAEVDILCNNLPLANGAPKQPKAHYVGDPITLAVDRRSIFNFIYGSSNDSLGEGNAKTVRAPGPGHAVLAAQTLPGTTWGNCELITRVYSNVDAQISSIAGDRLTVSELTFRGASSGGAGGNSYLWIFGDGETSTARTGTHSYNRAGTYTVQFTVKDRYGRSDSASQTITISDNPNVPGQPSLIMAEFAGCNGASATYTLDWNASGIQPSNYFAYEFKPASTGSWYPIQWLTRGSKIEYGLTPSVTYDVRVRGCMSNFEGTCGPFRERSFTVQSCGGGGGSRRAY